MYVDKPMRDHNLMQAIARVNRVFRDKEGGLVVDYIGIAAELRRALNTYTESGRAHPGAGSGRAPIPQVHHASGRSRWSQRAPASG
jgi:type I restriction enzyme R subunit